MTATGPSRHVFVFLANSNGTQPSGAPRLGHRSPTMSQRTTTPDRSFTLPPLGDNPSTDRQGTTPGSFAHKGRIGTPYTFSSPDTAGMPGISDRTAWDFL